MQKTLLFLFTFILINYSFSQPITNRGSSAVTVLDSRFKAGLNMFLPQYADTAAALSGTNEGIDSSGALVYIYDYDGLAYRGNSPKKWNYIAKGAATNDWHITGNDNIVDGTNFIGTTTNVPLNFRVNNDFAGRIDADLYNSFYGISSGNNAATGNSNTAIGGEALNAITTGFQNTGIGRAALLNNSTGVRNTAVGRGALLSNTSGTNNTAIGYSADVLSVGLTNATAIGANALIGKNNAISLGDSTANTKVGIGTAFPRAALHISAPDSVPVFIAGSNVSGLTRIAIDDEKSKLYSPDNTNNFSVTNDSTTSNKRVNYLSNIRGTFTDLSHVDKGYADSITNVSSNAGWKLLGNSGTNPATNFIGTTDNNPLVFRVNAQKSGAIYQTSASTFLGFQSGINLSSGTHNTGYGSNALFTIATGVENTAVGSFSLYNTSGNHNTGIGYRSLYTNITGSDNTSGGYQSLYGNVTGTKNTSFGVNALFVNITGSYNTALGYGADVISNNLNNTTAIGANAKVGLSNAISLGDSTLSTKVGIGTAYPDSILSVRGGFKLVNGTQGANKILQSDANGGASWVVPSSIATNNIYNSNGMITPVGTTRSVDCNSGSLVFNNFTEFYIGGNGGENQFYSGPDSTMINSPYDPEIRIVLNDSIKIVNGTEGAGKILQSDALGNTTWATIGSLLGDYFLNGGNSFGANSSIGTNDNYGLSIKTNNVERIGITNTGYTTITGDTTTITSGGYTVLNVSAGASSTNSQVRINSKDDYKILAFDNNSTEEMHVEVGYDYFTLYSPIGIGTMGYWQMSTGDLTIAGSATANKLNLTTGANKSVGTATLSSGTVTVNTTAVTSSSLIFVTYNTPSGTLAAGLSAPSASIVNGTSFVINSLTTAGIVNTLDNSTVRWWIIN